VPRGVYQPPWPLSWWRAATSGRGASRTIIIMAGEVDERGIEAALAARRIRGGIAGVVRAGGDGGVGRWKLIQSAQLPAILRGGRIRDVVFAGRSAALCGDALCDEAAGLPARIWLAAPVAGGGYQLVPMLGSSTPATGAPLKRLFDILAAAALLALAAPLMFAIAATLWLTGTRRIFYGQQRTGAGGKMFRLLKFRTMSVPDGAAFLQAAPGDARVTPFGRFLRKTSLDELPQLVNVLRGEMSLVGPRPHAPATTVAGLNFEDAAKFYRLRYRVKPGITGLAQIRGQRGATGDLLSLARRVSSDLEYIETWSLRLDVLILLRTIPAVLRPRNAY